MIKKTVTYVDFDEQERTEDFYFNLTQAELTKMFNSVSGGLEKYLDQIIKTKDAPKIMENFEAILKASYGVKTNDGRGFMKSEELFESFKATQAYSDIFMELCTDAEAAAAFIKGILPKNLAAEIDKSPLLAEVMAN